MTENALATEIVDAAYQVHTLLGPGLLESVYHRAMEQELRIRRIPFSSEVPIDVSYKGVAIASAFRIDLLVSESVVVELKSVERTDPVHKKQLLTYLKLADKRLGLLINFGAPTIKAGITRLVNRLPENQ
jgi:GxxExxY protein